MRIQDIQNLTGNIINQMNRDELMDAVKSASRISSQRISNIRRYSGGSPAVRGLENAIGQVPRENTINNMTLNQLRHVLTEEKIFLTSQTSTVTGTRERYRNIIASSMNLENLTSRQISRRINKRISELGGPRGINELLNMLDRIRELDPVLEYQIGSSTTRGEGFFHTVVEAYNNEDFQDIIDDPVAFAERIRQQYENTIEQQSEIFEF